MRRKVDVTHKKIKTGVIINEIEVELVKYKSWLTDGTRVDFQWESIGTVVNETYEDSMPILYLKLK